MTREAFERLISDWLDDQHNPSLRAAIDAAVQADPRLADVAAEWKTFGRQLRAGMPDVQDIDWAKLRATISNAVYAASNADAAIDSLLAASPTLDQTIDWSRLKDRISSAVDADAAGHRRSRSRTLWLAGVAATTLTAAAALVIALLPRTDVPVAPKVAIGSVAVVSISVPEPGEPQGVAIARITGGEAPATPQSLFMIDPPRPRTDEAAAGYF